MAWKYCSKEDVENYSGFSQDRLEDSWSEWIEGLIEERIGRTYLGTSAYTESYDGDGTDLLLLKNIPVVSVSSLTISDVNVNASEYKVYAAGYIRLVHSPGSGIAEAMGTSGAAFPVGQQNVTVTYTAGEADVPQHIRMAAALAISQVALISERAGAEGSLSLSMAGGRDVGERERDAWKLDSSARILQILDRLIGRKWKFK